MTKRQRVLEAIKVAGYHQDTKAFLRLYTENRLSYSAAEETRLAGVRARQKGIKCTCYACNHRPTF